MGLERAATGAWDLRPLNQDEFWARNIALEAQVARGQKAGIRLRSLNVAEDWDLLMDRQRRASEIKKDAELAVHEVLSAHVG